MIRTGLYASALLFLVSCGGSQTQTGDPAQSTSRTEEAQIILIGEPGPYLNSGAPGLKPDNHDRELSQVDARYGSDWYVGYGWPGEYPEGFSINRNGVVISARALPGKHIPRNLMCPLRKGATYQQWNKSRGDRDDLIFVSASHIISLTFSRKASFEVYGDDDTNGVVRIPVRTGDRVELLRYYGEGFGEIRYKNAYYDADLQQFTAITRPNKATFDEDLWVKVTCDDKKRTRAWILYSEAMKARGVISTPITDYGNSRDLY